MSNLAIKSECTGCSACVNICPENCLVMTMDTEGFFYPQLINEEKCINCHKCEGNCPILCKKDVVEKSVTAFAAYSVNESIRADSSSGGIFTEIAKEILKNNGCVYGAAYDEEFKVNHICVKKDCDLAKLRGAKYSQSDLKNCFIEIKDYLERGISVLFTGTPCQVAGLKSFLQRDYSNLLTIDFVCHGVPSPMVWEKYVKYRAQKDNNGKLPQKINLRSKESGWSRYSYSTSFEYTDKNCFTCINSDNIFMKLFVNDYINRESCSHCKFKGYNRMSDITLGDFWGIWDIDPEMDDNKGTSMILLHSQRGRQILDKIAGNLVIKNVTLEQVSLQNPSLLVSSPAKVERVKVLQISKLGEFAEIEQQFRGKGNKTIFRCIINKIRSVKR